MLKGFPLVSIVVPVYNQEKYLYRSIPAIINQQYENLEIVLVNDGSTDNSENILRDFAAMDSRIKVIEKENGGLVDATIAGIEKSTGEYIAFMDPDDYIGSDFIFNFISELDMETDIISAGFFYDNRHMLHAFSLQCDAVYRGKDLRYLQQHILKAPKGANISTCLFMARWNKLYRASCVKKIIREFSQYKSVTLGEDSLFTYLVLRECSTVKTLELVNSYYYNIDSSSSMMKNTDVKQHLAKAESVCRIMKSLLTDDGFDTIQADYLYYFLVNSLMGRLASTDKQLFICAYQYIRKSPFYIRAVSAMLKQAASVRERLTMGCRKYLSPSCYYAATVPCRQRLVQVRDLLSDFRPAITSFKTGGLRKARNIISFRWARRTQMKDLKNELPGIEERILPFLKPYLGRETDLGECPVSRKVFVFWWDGFDNSPNIVKACLKSVQVTHSDDEVILLSKNNYEKYTDIDIALRQGFERGEISVQTFSDILRFNVLKNNGGTWVDATLYFCAPYDLTNTLDYKSFESLNCNTTPDFLKYQGYDSTWTGFFIASRRNAVLVQAIDSVFREYFIQYGSYPIYLFIDAVLMICLKYGSDGNVLKKVRTNPGYLFEMLSLLDKPQYDAYILRFASIPQKLNWSQSATSPVPGSVRASILSHMA